MAEVQWIKLDKDIFRNRKIRAIERMQDADTLLVIWLKILTLAGDINDGGLVYFTHEIPYTTRELAAEFSRDESTVQRALDIFLRFGMIEFVDDVIMVSNWEKYQNIEGMERIREQNRQRVQRYRERQQEDASVTCNVTDGVAVTLRNAIDKNREDKNREDKNIKEREVKRFAPPTPEEVKAYTKEADLPHVDADAFLDYYQQQGWKLSNGTAMKDWKAAARNWNRREAEFKQKQQQKQRPSYNPNWYGKPQEQQPKKKSKYANFDDDYLDPADRIAHEAGGKPWETI